MNKRLSLAVLIVGLAALVGGVVFWAVDFSRDEDVSDAEYLVQVGTWVEQDAEAVVWNFMEIGKGTLTNNAHINDYDFIWALDGDKLKIETDWLYALANEYEYNLEGDVLTLKNKDKTVVFVPVGAINQ